MLGLATLTLMMASLSESFLMTKVDPGRVVVKPGDSLSLLCVVDSSYEYCKWINPQGQECDFEWKRAKGNITTQECHGAFKEKTVFHGKYDDRECGITIASATFQDEGTWRCEVEEYVLFGSRGSGSLQSGQIEVTVQNPATTPPPTPSTTPRTTPRTKSTTLKLPTTTTTTTSTTTTTRKETTSSRLPDPQPKSSLVPNSGSENPAASPSVQEDQETGGSSAGVVGGVLLALIVAVAAVFGVFYYRRRKEQVPIVNYATAADNANTGITIHSDRDENTNFHEYFPPNMTYSTSTPQSDA